MHKEMSLFRKIHNLFHPAMGKVLMLHRVVEHIGPQREASSLEVTAGFFAESLDAMLKQGVDFISVDQIAKRLESRNKNTFVCLTFDDGYLDNYTLAYPILKERQIPFCVYMTRDYYRGVLKPQWNPTVEMMDVNQLLELSSDTLCTIGVHTCTHPHLSRLSVEGQYREINECKTDLEQLIGKTVRHMAYPHGDYNQETLRIVCDLGIETAVTTSGCQVRDDSSLLELDRVFFLQS